VAPPVAKVPSTTSSQKKQCFINLREHKERARVHFIPDLKVGVFVTLRAPDVINPWDKDYKTNNMSYIYLSNLQIGKE
jgi:hypothetical protein